MKRLILLLFFALFFPFSLHAAEPVIHVVIAADGRAGLGANLIADRRNMERLFRENVPNNRLNLVLMDMDSITPDSVLQTVNRLELTESDTLVFYYSGRAAHNADSSAGVGGHFFQLRDEQGQLVRLYRRTLLAALNEKNARLTVLLTDCCNVEDEATDDTSKSVQLFVSPEAMSPVFEALLVRPEGIVDITSSKLGEASFVDASAQRRGSCFTWPLVALFEKHRDNGSMTWQEFTTELTTEVHNAFHDSHPDGFTFYPPLNGIAFQKTQTVEIFGILPGTVQSPVVVQQGPRFGVRAVNHPGGGVRITYVLPGGPGARAGFEVGDIILEINGKPIHNESDYSDAIDISPKRTNMRIINVNDGRELNVTFDLGF